MEINIDWLIAARAIAVAETALILALLFKQRESTIVLRLSQLIAGCVLCYILSEAYRPASIQVQPPFIWYALISGAAAIPALYWALARAVFYDDFEWGKKEWAVVSIYQIGWMLFLVLDYFWKFELGLNHKGFMVVPLIMQGALALWALYIVTESWRIDLMQSRRRLRLVTVFIIGGYTLLSLIFESTGVNSSREGLVMLIHTGSIAGMGFIVLFSFGRINVADFFLLGAETTKESSAIMRDTQDPPPEAKSVEIPTLIPNWDQLLARIQKERLYAGENITISKLADLISVPEYRLRKQIVQSMRYRNFNQFLNHFRIEEAADRLKSEEERKTPILSIAMDVGFRSLPSFNRSFKERYLMTPSEYRKLKADQLP
ncbi:MAG: helix-turn-helix transcriptional regulator [Pseudomonadales bacterium]|nr:helix-turn-helix transcriptional regulator [Pseudomonadales bacterium]